jgi:predicted ATPase
VKIESLRIKNYKAFRDVEVTDLPGLCVIVGANGTGKTTLFDVFAFLRDCVTYDAERALQARGGFREILSREAEEKVIRIEIRIRMEASEIKKEKITTYALAISEEEGRSIISKEELYGSGTNDFSLSFKSGKGSFSANQHFGDRAFEKIIEGFNSSNVLALKAFGHFPHLSDIAALRQFIANFHIFDFDLRESRGHKEASGFSDHLSSSGDNLQLVAKRLQAHYPDIFRKIIEIMKRYIPGFDDVKIETTLDNRLLLMFKDSAFKDPFLDKHMSDGTMKMFAYLVLLHDSSPHPLLCVEEPENHLYPRLLEELAEEFRAYSSRGGQVFVSTHSPDFLNAVEFEETFWLTKKNGHTQIKAARDDEQIVAYMKDGDKMGYLWQEGLISDADPQ